MTFLGGAQATAKKDNLSMLQSDIPQKCISSIFVCLFVFVVVVVVVVVTCFCSSKAGHFGGRI